ncbi:MAG TPA: formate dehydrogenase accessory sulfurtransferase FdhD [Spirochaetota bacterium]|nr:formate dehydrogenase accessory sulfurtransferase FdhD [Spirochaetota bacterium]
MKATGPKKTDDWPSHGQFSAVEYSDGAFSPVTTSLSIEYQVTLCINGSPYIVIACSGSDLVQMAVGHLVSEGIVATMSDITDVTVDRAAASINVITEMNERVLDSLLRLRRMPSGCGQGAGPLDDGVVTRRRTVQLKAPMVLSMMKEFLNYSKTHKLTRSVHGAALYTAGGEMIVFFDEIGRHNAIDKVLGHALLEGIDLGDKLLLTTGRIASEIAVKVLHTRIPVLISRASPTSLSCELAARHGLGMIGRVRPAAFCVFNGSEHVVP